MFKNYRFFKKQSRPKILFISSGDQPDYQCDMIFHGLKSLFGKDVYETSLMWYMYNNISPLEKQSLYGKGFTLYGNLDPNLQQIADKLEIAGKIKNRFYHKIIYGSIQRDYSYLDQVANYYAKEDVYFIDGEDETTILKQCLGVGRYYKRELDEEVSGVYPIQFCIPKEKICEEFPLKNKQVATIIPGKLETYIFDDEKSYYRDYQESYFAHTKKKAGWDCLRHYEILANACVPIFENLSNCPKNTMFRLPKDLILNEALEDFEVVKYRKYISELSHHLHTYLTTEAMVKYLMGG